MIKTKHIDAAREARLWLAQIVMPMTIGYVLVKKPEVIDKLQDSIRRIQIKNMFGF